MTSIPRYITIRDALEITGIKSRTTFDRICREKKIAKYKFGRSVRFLLSEVQDKLLSSRVA